MGLRGLVHQRASAVSHEKQHPRRGMAPLPETVPDLGSPYHFASHSTGQILSSGAAVTVAAELESLS